MKSESKEKSQFRVPLPTWKLLSQHFQLFCSLNFQLTVFATAGGNPIPSPRVLNSPRYAFCAGNFTFDLCRSQFDIRICIPPEQRQAGQPILGIDSAADAGGTFSGQDAGGG